jgi:catechol 2,3-dioxygenase-like lactoylglutathione lyase family enzyme
MLKSVTLLILATVFWFSSGYAWAQSATAAPGPVTRPPIVGVAWIALKTDDLTAARNFYGHILGFQEAFDLPGNPRVGDPINYFKVNDHQYIEVLPTLKDANQDRLSDIAFETTDADQLRAYLQSKGIKVPEHLGPRRDRNLGFHVTDPDGHDLEFVQYRPGSLQGQQFGKFLPDSRVSTRIIHVGFIVKDRAAEDHFYADILGFKSIWHGGMKDTETDWVDMRVPDGTDWLEYMLNVRDPDVRTRGVMHHLALGVPDIQAGYKTAVERGYKSEEKPQVGRDGKWQYNLYDPNFTRVEMMEPKPVEKPCCSPMLQ